MSRLILMRHGQASFTGEVYDALSPLGFEQATQVGRWWKTHKPVPDEVWTGPLRRQRETAESLAQASWPVARNEVRLDEFADRDAILDSPEARRLLAQQRLGEVADRIQAYQSAIEAWTAGRVQLPGTPPIQAFRARIAGWLDECLSRTGSGRTVLAVTSAGVIATAVAALLEAPNSAIPRVLRVLRNASMTEILFSGSMRSLNSINDVQALSEHQLTLM